MKKYAESVTLPHVLVRIGGASFDLVEQLDSDVLKTLIEELITQRSKCKERIILFNDESLEFIKKTECPKTRNLIQNLRRDLFNSRRVKLEKVRLIKLKLDTELSVLLDEILDIEADITLKIEEINLQFQRDLELNRGKLEVLRKEPSLQKGLLLSSKILSEKLSNKIYSNIQRPNKKEKRLEYSLLRYLARICCKTSPFSSFTNVFNAKYLAMKGQNWYEFEKIDYQPTTVSYIRFNNFILKYFIDLILSYRPARQQFDIRINPTITRKGDVFEFLLNSNNIESFQKLTSNEVIQSVFDCLSSDSDYSFHLLLKTITDKYELAESDVEDYLIQLFRFGFIEIDFGTSGISHDWVKELLSIANKLNGIVPRFNELCDTLNKVIKLSELYPKKGFEQRKSIINETKFLLDQIYYKLHEAAKLPENERIHLLPNSGIAISKEVNETSVDNRETAFSRLINTNFKFKLEEILYEDTSRLFDISIEQEAINEFTKDMNSLSTSMEVFDSMPDELTYMRDYFSAKYVGAPEIPILMFYEDYYKDVKNPNIESNKSNLSLNVAPVEKSEEAKARVQKQDSWEKVVLENFEKYYNGDSVNFNTADLAEINSVISYVPRKKDSISHSAFIQLFKEGHQTKVILNLNMMGYGKMWSRFLFMFNDELTNSIKEHNQELIDENEIYAEINDASYFNANIHPPLLPLEIGLPGGNSLLPISQQVPITDLYLKIDKVSNRLILFQKSTGKQVFIFDLGFQGVGRSNLFGLLKKFTKGGYIFSKQLQNIVTDHLISKWKETSEVLYIPRVTINNRIIVSRKSWIIRKESIPSIAKTERSANYFIRLNEWRIRMNLPDCIFLSIGIPNKSKVENAKLIGDDYKPQYISFLNPLTVPIMEKLLLKAKGEVTFTEMLPNSEQMLRFKNEKYATELLVEWYNKN